MIFFKNFIEIEKNSKEFRYCIDTYSVMIEIKPYRNWNWNDFQN